MAFLIIFVALGLIPAFIAQKRGRDFGGWWIYGALVFPIALIHSLLLEPDKIAIEERLVSEGNKKCPFCAEMIKKEAKVCRYCGRDIAVNIPKDIVVNIPKGETLKVTTANTCPKCLKEYDDTWKVCLTCNTRLIEKGS